MHPNPAADGQTLVGTLVGNDARDVLLTGTIPGVGGSFCAPLIDHGEALQAIRDRINGVTPSGPGYHATAAAGGMMAVLDAGPDAQRGVVHMASGRHGDGVSASRHRPPERIRFGCGLSSVPATWIWITIGVKLKLRRHSQCQAADVGRWVD